MAQSVVVNRTFSLEAQEELICSLCYELFCGLYEPKQLDCAHVFCQICLLRMVGMESSITCPECRHVTNVPTEGIAAMKCPLRLRNLAVKYTKYSSNRRTSAPHLTQRKSDEASCSKHNGEKMHFLCVTCDISICQFCLVRSHTPPFHEIKEIKTSREELQSDLANAIDYAEEAKTAFEADANRVTDLIQTTKCSFENELTAIDTHVEQVIEAVRKRGKKLKNRIQLNRKSCLANIHQEKEQLEDRIQSIKVTQAKARKTRASLPDQVYKTRYTPLVNKLELLSIYKSEFKASTHLSKFVAEPSALQIQLGRVETRVAVQQVAEFGNFEFARGISAVPGSGGFAVTDFYGQQITFVKDNGTYKGQTRLEPKDRKYGPTDIAVTADGMYILATWTGIETYSSAGVVCKSGFSSDCSASTEGIYSVAITPDNRVLVGNIELSTIAIHNSDGKLVKILKVKLHPYNIATDGQHVAISNTITNTVAVVCLESGEELFRIPVEGVNGLCYESTSDSLLVGKTVQGTGSQSTIEQYCAVTGQWISQIAKELYSPQALALAEDGILAVADRKNVKVFQMICA